MGWISVKDRLPETGERVLLLLKSNVIIGIYAVQENSDGDGYNFMNDDLIHYVDFEYVSHWMPLPAPPKDGE